jgi:hypothetical protein
MESQSGKQLAMIAVPFGQDSLTQGLLNELSGESATEAVKPRVEDLVEKIKIYGLFYGIFVGFFVECGAIIAHVLIQTKIFDQSPTKTEIFLFSLAWASITSVLPCVALSFLRTILVASHRLSRQGSRDSDSRLDMILWSLESRFGVGSFFGVSFAVTLLDIALGLTSHIFLTATLLTVVVASFSFMNGFRCESRQTKVGYLLLNESHQKCMASVNPCCLEKVEIKPGSLLLV